MTDGTALETAKYLTFRVGGGVYATAVTRVQEVLAGGAITEVPGIPPAFLGVLEVRGTVVPVMSLEKRFGRSITGDPAEKPVVILEVSSPEGEGTVVVGALVDSVEEVLEIDENSLEPPPAHLRSADSRFVESIASGEDGMIVVLSPDRIFHKEEIEAIGELAERETAAPARG